jgi:hypothetical protein
MEYEQRTSRTRRYGNYTSNIMGQISVPTETVKICSLVLGWLVVYFTTLFQ